MWGAHLGDSTSSLLLVHWFSFSSQRIRELTVASEQEGIVDFKGGSLAWGQMSSSLGSSGQQLALLSDGLEDILGGWYEVCCRGKSLSKGCLQ